MKTYSNRFAEMEPNPDGTWALINLVTGVCVLDSVSYKEARGQMDIIYKHYAGVEKQAGW